MNSYSTIFRSDGTSWVEGARCLYAVRSVDRPYGSP